ncbi:MAG: arginine--tRNA ligase [bacterium]
MTGFIKTCIKRILKETNAGEEIHFDVMKAPPFTACDYATNVLTKLGPQYSAILRQKLLEENIFEEVKIQMPFLNMRLTNDFIKEMFLKAVKEQRAVEKNKEKFIIEFISANPTGPIHIGHIRGGVLGDCLARILRHRGCDVETQYYVNDRGRQVKLLAESVVAAKNKQPAPADGYSGEYIEEIAGTLDGKLETGEIQKIAVQKILGGIKDDLVKLDIKFDTFFFETSLYEKDNAGKTLQILKEKNVIFEKDNAIWLNVEDWDSKDRVLFKKDGEPTYFFSDIMYHREKFRRAGVCINVWGADHHGYTGRIKRAVGLLGYNPDNLKIVLCQIVRLKRGGEFLKMSKREGNFLTAGEVMREVGRDAVRFFLLTRKANAQLDFDLELAKERTQKNPVYYIQYANARICSIFEKAKQDNLKAGAGIDSLGDESRELLRQICEFEDTVELCAAEYAPHHLASYLLALASSFHNFYDRNRVILEDRNVTEQRLLLISGVRKVLGTGLGLLGISAPEKM